MKERMEGDIITNYALLLGETSKGNTCEDKYNECIDKSTSSVKHDGNINNKYITSIITDQIDLVHDSTSTNFVGEDRISNLPDDIIHRILSFLDMKYAIQTSTLSKKWKHIWTSMPYLRLDTQTFPTLREFAKFTKHALSHRNYRSEVSSVDLTFTGSNVNTKSIFESIVKYAYSHNARKLCVTWSRMYFEFPEWLFSCRTLKHLTLEIKQQHYPGGSCLPNSAWDFPNLETIHWSNMKLGLYGKDKSVDLFSKCVNLKDLTLHHCAMYGVDIFNIRAPKLSNLTITNPDEFPKVFNVVAPQLENLTASVVGSDSNFMQLTTNGLVSLEKVNLSLSTYDVFFMSQGLRLLDLFKQLHSAKFLILDNNVIEVLSGCLDSLSHEPCPFNNLKCLKMGDHVTTIPIEVINYMLESSPTATLIVDLPKVLKKRLRDDEDNVANKVAKLEEEKQMQDEVIAQQNAAIVEAIKLQHEKLIFHKMEELQVQVAGGNIDYEIIRSIKLILELTPEILRVPMKERVSCQYEEMKSLFFTRIDASHWAKMEIELGNYL